ncbi:beta-ketoacyl synthase N-terminal-like domain-containing protein [Frankia sp. Cas4]|uniref:beta-ketoacyl synthase N-terminal-like domain-containing protein n=1 Tax=Frankia sp. Cas4 TaxID=3073927 RepID=UPI002AD4664A|nr:beta-ketoacyl synthase N-terminal-like domain-containing protein [Frankia sp. Cas4]
MTGRPREPRAVVTGIGIVCASGIGTDTYWKTALSGESRIGRIGGFDPSRYDTTLAGEVPGFEAADHMPSRFIVQTDRWTQLAFCAAGQALADAEIDPAALDPYEMSVALASGSGGNAFGQRELQRLWSSPSHTVGAYQSIAWFYAATVGQLSIMYGMKGPSMVLVSESAGGLDSLAHAARLVRRGTPVVLAGGTEAPLSPYALTCQQHNHAMTARTDPARAYCPFDLDADGYVPGEGGAVLVIEDLDHALARGAPVIYGEIAGAAATFDGRPRPPRRGSGGDVEQYARAMTTALRRAGVRPGDVDVVFPDALGVPAADRDECAAMWAAFGPASPAVTTQKPLVGRLYQGGAALDAATALLAMRHDLLPPTAGTRAPAQGCRLNFVSEVTPTPVFTAMVNARGFDGFNTSLVLRRCPEIDFPEIDQHPGSPSGVSPLTRKVPEDKQR